MFICQSHEITRWLLWVLRLVNHMYKVTPEKHLREKNNPDYVTVTSAGFTQLKSEDAFKTKSAAVNCLQ